MMAKIAETTEEHLDYDTHFMKAKNKVSSGISEAVGYAAVSTAIALNADCIITPTFYGHSGPPDRALPSENADLRCFSL